MKFISQYLRYKISKEYYPNTLHPLLDQGQCVFGCKHDSCVILGGIMALLLSYLEIKPGFKRYIWVPS